MTRGFFPYINRVMAMRRCPYCKAIIDESSEYCSNCGTRLLFPEDESIEEEIPGERIVDEEPEEEIEEESGRSKREEAGVDEPLPEEESEEDFEFEEEKSEPIESAEERLEEEEAEEPSVEEALEKGKLEPPHMAPTDTEEYEGRTAAERTVEEREERGKIPIEQETEKEEEKKEEGEKVQKELTFKTEERERVIDTTEKEKEDIERFLDSIKRDRAEKKIPMEESPPPPSSMEDERAETEQDIPPWAARMKDSPPEEIPSPEDRQDVPFEMEERLSLEDEKPLDEKTPAFDSGIGIPEEVGQRSIPFDEAAKEERKSARIRGPSTLASWLKSKAFDIFFVGAFWLIALWAASRSMEVSLFQLISASARTVIIFYGILLVSYYFLFLLFLGETLGDHLFSEER